MDTILNHTGQIIDIHTEHVELNESFLDFAGRFIHLPGSVLLASGGSLDCARYHILAIKPWLAFSGRNNTFKITVDDQTVNVQKHPFEILRYLLDIYTINNQIPIHSDMEIPVQAGLFGYFSYDLKDCLEELPRTSVDDLLLPHICLFAPSIIIVHDRIAANTTLN
ncbi:MAG: aminodeoxychorismate synthase, component I, partial [Deltaproteobacteria bacterium]|nr:aminodeoxychorismate synthase, component I [Deltaproteobacteria bacterium]